MDWPVKVLVYSLSAKVISTVLSATWEQVPAIEERRLWLGDHRRSLCSKASQE
jgi:hypothetical protein